MRSRGAAGAATMRGATAMSTRPNALRFCENVPIGHTTRFAAAQRSFATAMTLAVPEWLAHVFLVAVSVELVVRATLRVLKYRARRDASASGTPAPVAASVVVVNPGKTRQGRTALYWSSALALAASVILGVAYWQGDLAVFSGLGRADLMPEREWMMSTAGFRYQWVAIGKDSIDGRVPVLDCAQWAPESALALQTLLLRPIPPYSRAALDDAQRHMEEEAAHTDMRESRDKGASLLGVCVV